MSLDALGAVACDRGDLAGAADRYRSSLRLWLEVETKDGLAFWLTGVAVLAVAAEQPALAARLFGAAAARQEAAAVPLRPPWWERRERAVRAARFALGDAAYDEAAAAGRALAVEEAMAEASARLTMLERNQARAAPAIRGDHARDSEGFS